MKRMSSRAKQGIWLLARSRRWGCYFRADVQVDLRVLAGSGFVGHKVRSPPCRHELRRAVCYRPDCRPVATPAGRPAQPVPSRSSRSHTCPLAPSWRPSPGGTSDTRLTFIANDEIIFAVVVAGVIRVNSVNRGIHLVRNLIRDSFLKEPFPLLGNGAAASHFLGITGSNLNSDDREFWSVPLFLVPLRLPLWVLPAARAARQINPSKRDERTYTKNAPDRKKALRARSLNLHHFFFFALAHLFHLLDFVVGQLLDFIHGPLLVVLGDLSCLSSPS